ncbi:SlyX family protein [Kangiella geojedonensis]|uniref:Protein SlyX homolog n=1 Tax=Kangiella geojedonensis TaxID=914150 RepID=A0A0F6TPJ2_9GAMM|nr:SlyX family protein [Kangiella geojedonensis]AKE51654.1 SlyX family protein [Kangiella geojedonensis]
MSTLDSLQHQIDELQTKLAFQDDTIEQLNRIVSKQDEIIRLMQAKFSLIGDKIQTIESNLPNKAFNPDDEVPPHY